MRALTWQGIRNVRVDTVPDPRLIEPTDAIIKVTSTSVCGSDLHLYELMGPFLSPGDILGHERMGMVEETGSLGINDLVTHRATLEEAAEMHEVFQKKEDDCIKVILTP